ncbi:NAD(P)-dependent oxidoreductase [Periweissella ghanensis]|uniref:Glyoxylate/hydroxypyruvate reductase B n=1 Tax=Periweissella ghanensis TaxID=467997 RepID=A0ABM8ZA88_9LACO|nr:NAD(P)-dependent oxidoreductase [Periweissella ghanensis]MCM0600530.1 NAD-binding protein [Periweissella ghanensis]CAH0418260.1 Glyoxylate/hydroxypyruvate reductase B [Periweissella ghanensis]
MSQLLATFCEIPEDVLEELQANDTTVIDFKDLQPEDYPNVSILLGWDAKIGNAILDEPTSKLKWIQTHSAGIDYLPHDKIAAKNITVTNASGVHAEQISQSVIGDILYFTRGLNTHVTNSANKVWDDVTGNTYVLSELKVLILGTGNIGIELAKNLHALHVKVSGINHSGRAVEGFDKTYAIADYATAVKDADIIVNILPGTEETRDFFNDEFFSHIDDLFMFINVGRGFSVDNAALVKAVTAKKVRYVALDVTNPEPLPTDSILWDIPEVLITSHTTGQSHDYNLRLVRIFQQNLPSYFKDGSFIRNVVDLDKGY